MKLPLFKSAALVLENAAQSDLVKISDALNMLHQRFRNRSPFSNKDIANAKDPTTMMRLLARIGIVPPYSDADSVAKEILDFANSGGIGAADKSTPEISSYIDSSPAGGDSYEAAIRYHDVESNTRYKPRDITGDNVPETFCNIYVSDFMRTLGVPLPHVINGAGDPVPPGTRGSKALLANDTAAWLSTHGSRFGWKKSDEAGAQAAANAGTPALVIAPGKKHIAVIRPGTITENGAAITQAGKHLLQDSHVANGFGKELYSSGLLEYWINRSKENRLIVV
jgi:hypothetical protein